MRRKKISDYKCASRGCGKQAAILVGLNKVCSIDCAVQLGKKRAEKIKLEERREYNRETKRMKEKTKRRSEFYADLEREVNYYVKNVRDKDKPCCTCGKRNNDIKYDAGHFLSVGAHPDLRFELTNIHKQCSINCNKWGSGMRHEYTEFIKCIYGEDHLAWLEGPHKTLKERFPTHKDIEIEIKKYRDLNRSARNANN
jgi:hypothetical protein